MKDKASDAINSKLEDLNPKTEEVDLDADFGLSLDDLGMQEVPETDAPKTGAIDFEEGLVDDVSGKVAKAASGLKNAASDALKKAADATAGIRGAAAGGCRYGP